MTCRQIQRRLAGYAGGDLRRGRAEAVRAHLASCAACRAEYAALDEALGALRRAARPADPALTADRLWGALRGRLPVARASRRRTWYARPVPLPVGVVGALLIIVASGILANWIAMRAAPAPVAAPPAPPSVAYRFAPEVPFVLENAPPPGGGQVSHELPFFTFSAQRDDGFELEEVTYAPAATRRMRF
jgi:anti-sigma factor RsiW